MVIHGTKEFSELPSHQNYLNYMVVEKGPHGVALFFYLAS
jgi:hypothetical protein